MHLQFLSLKICFLLFGSRGKERYDHNSAWHLLILFVQLVRQLGFIPGTAVPETAVGECRAGQVGPADGCG